FAFTSFPIHTHLSLPVAYPSTPTFQTQPIIKMLFKNILTTSVLGLASFGVSSPVPAAERGVIVSSDTGSLDIGQVITDVKREIVARQELAPRAGNSGELASAILTIVSQVNNLIPGLIQGDLANRRVFTQRVAAAVSQQNPGLSVVVCNVGYSVTGNPAQSVTSVSYNAKVGSNVSFDVVVFRKGSTFTRRGDGGFENWAYIVPGCQANGAVLT
ncbi:hypothetical protein CI238_12173, partial [Colletotrichum incanum]